MNSSFLIIGPIDRQCNEDKCSLFPFSLSLSTVSHQSPSIFSSLYESQKNEKIIWFQAFFHQQHKTISFINKRYNCYCLSIIMWAITMAKLKAKYLFFWIWRHFFRCCNGQYRLCWCQNADGKPFQSILDRKNVSEWLVLVYFSHLFSMILLSFFCCCCQSRK